MTTKPLNDGYAQSIRKNVDLVRQRAARAAERAGRSPADIQLMAVTKTVAPEYVNVAVECGMNLLGENRAQELLEKHSVYTLGPDCIHFIGHLQRNKVKSIIDKVSMIESVDSISLAEEIDRQASRIGVVMPVLLEVNIGMQPTKSGFAPDALEEGLRAVSGLKSIAVKGLMAIPPKDNTKEYFQKMQQLSVDIAGKNIDNSTMEYLSMGMSADYELAIACGANIVRVGSALFGQRK